MASSCAVRVAHGACHRSDKRAEILLLHCANPSAHVQEPMKRYTSRTRCQQVANTISKPTTSEWDFTELADMCGTGLNKVTARATDNQLGLVATEAIEKGELIIQVPLAVRKPACFS